MQPLVGAKFRGVSLHGAPHTSTATLMRANRKHGSSLGCPHAPARTVSPPERGEHHEGTALCHRAQQPHSWCSNFTLSPCWLWRSKKLRLPCSEKNCHNCSKAAKKDSKGYQSYLWAPVHDTNHGHAHGVGHMAGGGENNV